MGVFDDKEYENMDWISQAVEPIKSPLNDILSKLPEEETVDFKTYNLIKRDSYSMGLTVSDVVRWWLSCRKEDNIAYDEQAILEECFEFQIQAGTQVDFNNNKINGVIRVIKVKAQLDEKELQKTLGIKGAHYVESHIPYNPSDGDDPSRMERLNEVIELLDMTHEARKTRSYRKKVKAVRHLLMEIMSHNKWNIKDADLADKVGYWIGDYVTDGNLPAFGNLIKLKLMTHKGLPIYSMAENKT